ncbi:MAG: tRNA (guanine37-N1)-methyltransferase [Patescibacteria group bacterium]|jgi:tRNA (guanine37-N1)-methyltransferase|nr:tRNA (guanine37-N1)-methyltransferase [Patescibacteria group bacterium]
MVFHIITLFPELLSGYLSDSILARAISEKKVSVKFYNPRDFVKVNKSQKAKEKPYLRVDDKPYGGGPGMVIEALPILKAVEGAKAKIKNQKAKIKTIFFSPGGKKFDTAYAKNVSKKFTDIILICGRYEGIDARVKKILKAEEVSVGDFVLTGGEIPAMILIDSISRQIEGVLGNFDSREEERVASSEVYTRPEVLEYKGKKYKVPKVLLSGNHKKIEEWRGKKFSA